MRWRLPHVVGVLLVLTMVPASASAALPEAVLHVAADGDVRYDGPAGLLTLARAEPGERMIWNVSSDARYLVLDVHVDGAFEVDRPKQVVPFLEDPRGDPAFFVPVGYDPVDAQTPARVVRVEGEGTTFTYRLGIPGPYDGTLALVKDVTAPDATISAPSNVTHYGFRVTSTTSEPALAELVVRPFAGGDAIPFPTPHPAYRQTFPVQGLDAATPYIFTIAFEDWAGNNATSEPVQVTTLSEPEVPSPVVTVLSPSPGVVLTHVPPLQVHLDGNGSELAPPTLRVYVDLREREGPFQVVDDVLALDLGDLEVGLHRLTVEVQNLLGGKGIVTWTFKVADAETPAPGLALLLLGVAMAALRRS